MNKHVLVLAVTLAALAACSRAPQKHQPRGTADDPVVSNASAPAPNSGPAHDPVVQTVGEVRLTRGAQAGAHVASPLSIEGLAPNTWYSQGQFAVQLVGADGTVLAQTTALPQANWQQAGQVPFIADLIFNVSRDTQAAIVLKGQADGQEERIAVVAGPRD